jgi:integral membrane protein
MTDLWLIASFAKLFGLCLFVAGLAGAVLPAPSHQRARSALHLGTIGLVLTWLGGYALLKLTDRPLASPFVLQSMFVSLFALSASWITATSARPHAGWLAAPLVGLLSALGLMVTRDQPGSAASLALSAIAPLLLGAAGGLWLAPQHTPTGHDPARLRQITLRWWTWLARAEGSSLLLLLGVITPLKRGFGWAVDPHGYVGWLHGALVLLYLVSLWPMRRWHGWTASRLAAAFVASLLPFGTFVFERRLPR